VSTTGLAPDHDGFGKSADLEIDIHGCGEAGVGFNAFALDRRKNLSVKVTV
jgi:hypothetical protein